MSITSNQSRRIAMLVRELIEAEITNSWKGGGDPQDTPEIEADLVKARIKLATYLDHLENVKS